MMLDTRPRVTRWYERLTLVRAIGTILTLAVLLVLISGALARLVEPEVFTSLGLAYWWAITTVTTVGYGDVVPEDTAGRIVGALLMLTGLSLIPTLTSVIVAALVSKRNQLQMTQFEEELINTTAALQRIEDRLTRMEGRTGSST